MVCASTSGTLNIMTILNELQCKFPRTQKRHLVLLVSFASVKSIFIFTLEPLVEHSDENT